MEALSYSQGRYQNENSSWIIEEYPKGNFVVSKYTGLYPKEGKEKFSELKHLSNFISNQKSLTK